MQKVKTLLRLNYKDKVYEIGDIFEADNNDTHFLIEHGMVELNIFKPEENKMMTPKKKKGYVTK